MDHNLQNLKNDLDDYISKDPVFTEQDRKAIRESIQRINSRKNKRKWFVNFFPKTLSAIVVVFLLAFIGGIVNNQIGLIGTEKGASPGNIGNQHDDIQNPVVTAEKPPEKINLTYDFGNDQQFSEEAAYWESQNGFYMYIPENQVYTEQVEPGKDIIKTYEDLPVSIMQIEVLKESADVEEQKQLALDELRSIYPGQEPVESESSSDPFFKQTLFQISSQQGYETTSIMMIPIDGKTYKITIKYLESEKDIVVIFKSMIKTIGTVK